MKILRVVLGFIFGLRNSNTNMDQNVANIPDDLEIIDDIEDDEMPEANNANEENWSDGESDASESSSTQSRRMLEILMGEIRSSHRYVKDEYKFQPFHLYRHCYKERFRQSNFPYPRSGHRVIASDSHLYSLGGFNQRNAPRGACLLFQELWSYHFATNRWKLVANGASNACMPRELASNALVLHNNVLISHGGTGYPFGATCSNDCYVFSTGSTPVVNCLSVTGDRPIAQYGPGIVIHENYLYTIGGTTGFDYSCDVFRLNLTSKVWEIVYISRPEMRKDPEGRYRHEVVYDGHHIYVLGGGTSQQVFDLQRLPAYNLHMNRWDYFDTLPDRSNGDATYPQPRKCFSCVQYKNGNGDIEAFVTGGLQVDSGGYATYFSDVWRLNLTTKQWTHIRTAVLPKPLYFHSAASTPQGCMYIFGGIEYNKKDIRRRNNLYKMWMTIPKLTEICWDAITHYNEDLDCFSFSHLLRAGIPERFANRIHSSRVSSK